MPRVSGKHAALMMVVAAVAAAGAGRVALRVAPDALRAVPPDDVRAASEVRATPEVQAASAVRGAPPAPQHASARDGETPRPYGVDADGTGVDRDQIGRSPLLLAGTPQEGIGPEHSFYFTRVIYNGWGWGRRASWRTDFPKADRQFLVVLRRLIDIDVYPDAHALRLDDPEIRRYPFLYALEVGRMDLTEPEVRNLRGYLLAGGFLVIDDFWGTREWANFERNIRRVLPGREIVDLPMDHPIFTTFYEIDEVLQVPSINNIRWGRTWERDGFEPFVKAILDDKGRVMVLINWNTDLGDAWEWAEQPDYPLKYSTYAFQMGVNFIVYAMSH